MRFALTLAGLFVVLAFGMPAPGADDKKADPPAPASQDKKTADDKKPDTTPDDKTAGDKKPDDKTAGDKKPDAKPDDKKKAEDTKKEEKPGDKTEKPKEVEKKPETKERLNYTGTVIAKITDVQSSQKLISVEVTQKIPTPNTGAIQAMQNLQQQRLQIMTNPGLKPSDRYSQLLDNQRQMAQQQASMVSYKDETTKIDFTATDTMKVLVSQPPVEFDEKGLPKKYTQKELLAMAVKAPDGSLRFPGDFESMKQGQVVQVYYLLSTPPKARPKTKEKDVDPELLAESSNGKPKAAMVVVLREPPEQK